MHDNILFCFWKYKYVNDQVDSLLITITQFVQLHMCVHSLIRTNVFSQALVLNASWHWFWKSSTNDLLMYTCSLAYVSLLFRLVASCTIMSVHVPWVSQTSEKRQPSYQKPKMLFITTWQKNASIGPFLFLVFFTTLYLIDTIIEYGIWAFWPLFYDNLARIHIL